MATDLRASWPTIKVDGIPTRVRYTPTQLRKWGVVRNERGVITGLVTKSRATTPTKLRRALAALVAYVDGKHENMSAVENARELLK